MPRGCLKSTSCFRSNASKLTTFTWSRVSVARVCQFVRPNVENRPWFPDSLIRISLIFVLAQVKDRLRILEPVNSYERQIQGNDSRNRLNWPLKTTSPTMNHTTHDHYSCLVPAGLSFSTDSNVCLQIYPKRFETKRQSCQTVHREWVFGGLERPIDFHPLYNTYRYLGTHQQSFNPLMN